MNLIRKYHETLFPHTHGELLHHRPRRSGQLRNDPALRAVPRRYRRLQVYRDASSGFLTPDEAMGLPLANLKEKKIHSPSGKLMLILSPNEHTWFRDGKLARYLYVASKGRKQRAGISSPEDMPLIIPNVNAGIIYDVDLFASKNLHDRFIDKIDGRPCTIKYENAHYIISMERVE